jgi:hypothetical protein
MSMTSARVITKPLQEREVPHAKHQRNFSESATAKQPESNSAPSSDIRDSDQIIGSH